MMRVSGVVAEFNPFHNGHRALLEMARGQGVTHIAAVMSGNFVQRGTAAVADKRVRVRAALENGADLVVELPLPWAAAPAHRFALGACSLLRDMGCVDTLAFGSECGDPLPLERLAGDLERPALQEAMRPHLDRGLPLARARELAVREVLGPEAAGILSTPNNILGVEYLKQARGLGWRPEVLTFRRMGVSHDDGSTAGRYASASYLRAHPEELEAFVPPSAFAEYRRAMESGHFPCGHNALGVAILSRLRSLSLPELAKLPDLSEGLDRRLHNAVARAGSLPELEAALKTKRYPLARIRRLILAAFLGITREDCRGAPPYVRVLGFNRRGEELVSRMKATCPLPVHTSLSRLERLDGRCARLCALEAAAADQFALALPSPLPKGHDYSATAVFPHKDLGGSAPKPPPGGDPLDPTAK